MALVRRCIERRHGHARELWVGMVHVVMVMLLVYVVRSDDLPMTRPDHLLVVVSVMGMLLLLGSRRLPCWYHRTRHHPRLYLGNGVGKAIVSGYGAGRATPVEQRPYRGCNMMVGIDDSGGDCRRVVFGPSSSSELALDHPRAELHHARRGVVPRVPEPVREADRGAKERLEVGAAMAGEQRGRFCDDLGLPEAPAGDRGGEEA